MAPPIVIADGSVDNRAKIALLGRLTAMVQGDDTANVYLMRLTEGLFRELIDKTQQLGPLGNTICGETLVAIAYAVCYIRHAMRTDLNVTIAERVHAEEFQRRIDASWDTLRAYYRKRFGPGFGFGPGFVFGPVFLFGPGYGYGPPNGAETRNGAGTRNGSGSGNGSSTHTGYGQGIGNGVHPAFRSGPASGPASGSGSGTGSGSGYGRGPVGYRAAN
ncbi:hypothetical protein SLS53_002354 [Cytospora paraplurivora]|uniref:Uncharacterized protein n=1 Tax=Cytospora paraplurivora TaxID=2898453 RepID=A0AAN9UH49_9PEZI